MPSGVYKRTKEHTEKLRIARFGRVLSNETKKKISDSSKWRTPWNKGLKSVQVAWNKGIPHTEESKIKMSKTKAKTSALRGKPIDYKKRTNVEYTYWRKSCLLRDNFTCQQCGVSGGKLHAHHINNFAYFEELRYVVDNGIIFCDKCHILFHKIYGKKNNTEEQVIEFNKVNK